MGNIASLNKTDKSNSFGQVIDYIATYYILTADFESLKKLYNKDYCDNLIVLTSDILDRYFTDLEINYLAQRVKNGVEVNEMEKDNIIFFYKSDLDKFNITNPLKKKRVCIGIAKFYIKISHVFASIVTTINPVYVYKDVEGNTIKKKLFEKNQIPKNVQRKLYKLGICDNRINSLKRGQDLNTTETLNIHPKVCNMNINNDGDTKSLDEEPGIPELMDLYNDKYDYVSGNFIGMTEENQKLFKADLLKFYQIFTGNEFMPENVTKFSDIKLRDYHKLDACSDSDGFLKKNIQLNKSSNKEDKLKRKLFEDYAENLKQMIQSTNKNHDELLAIINKLFTYVIDPQTQKKRIIVHPELSEAGLQEIVVKTREIIIKLYLKCEYDFTTGVKLYQAIIEKQIKDTTLKQLDILEKESDKLISINFEPKIVKEPEPEAIPEIAVEAEAEKNALYMPTPNAIQSQPEVQIQPIDTGTQELDFIPPPPINK